MDSIEFERIKHRFVANGLNLEGVDHTEWTYSGDLELVTEYHKTWLGKLLLLPERKDRVKREPLEKFRAVIQIDVSHLALEMLESQFLQVVGKKRWGLFYSKIQDEVLRPTRKRLEYEMWDKMIQDLIKLKPQIQQKQREGLNQIKDKMSEGKLNGEHKKPQA